MNATSETLRPYIEGFKTFESGSKNGAAWLRELRHNAFSKFANHGFPDTHDEDWKYTSVRPLENRGFLSTQPTPVAITADSFTSVLLHELPSHTLVFVNGQYVPSLGTPTTNVSGVHISDLREFLKRDAQTLHPWFTSQTESKGNAFTALNSAFLQDGIVIEIDAGTRPDKPLQLVFVSTQQPQPCACYPRILLQLGAGADAMLVETHYGADGSENFVNSYAQIRLAEKARLEHLRMQCESPEDFHFSRVEVSQQHGSFYRCHTVNLGGRWVRTDLQTQLLAPQAQTIFNGLYTVDGRQHVDNHTRIDHGAPETRSDELYHGIINGHGRAVFNGKVLVAKGAVKTDASQRNHNLLLSRTGEIDTKPELEIYADDVQCSHGASIGQLDEQALFYLRSRGVGLETARSLLINAFANRMLDRLPNQELRAYVSRQITAMTSGKHTLTEPV